MIVNILFCEIQMRKMLTQPTIALMTIMGTITFVDSLWMMGNPIDRIESFQFRVVCYCLVSACFGVGLFFVESRRAPNSSGNADQTPEG